MKRPFRLFHFDVATDRNYGDTLLFPLVKEVFESYGAGRAFEIVDSQPLRESVGRSMVERINAGADAVVVGGGGLFLSDTNPNSASGWQWKISVPMLKALKVPIIVFAVGYNRFYRQEEFKPPFAEHLRLTMEKSIFFGIRNHGSMDRLADYVPPALQEKIVYQPCPTTISADLVPGARLAGSHPAGEAATGTAGPKIAAEERKTIGVQLINGKRQRRAGISNAAIVGAVDGIVGHLEKSGWNIVHAPLNPNDGRFPAHNGSALAGKRLVPLHGRDSFVRGFHELSELPAFLGTRGHAQMVPFGMGSMPFSLDVHPKLGYFLDDIERPEWLLDPSSPDTPQTAARLIDDAWENRAEHRAHLAAKRAEFLGITRDNLAAIYTALGGDPTALENSWAPYGPREFAMSNQRLLAEIDCQRNLEARQDTLLRLREAQGRPAGTPVEQALASARQTATLIRRATVNAGDKYVPDVANAARRFANRFTGKSRR